MVTLRGLVQYVLDTLKEPTRLGFYLRFICVFAHVSMWPTETNT
jgi:hypothetical protein